jgi:hypothetical protein
MANVMLATYPKLFAGGVIIGGCPMGRRWELGKPSNACKGGKPPPLGNCDLHTARHGAPDLCPKSRFGTAHTTRL